MEQIVTEKNVVFGRAGDEWLTADIYRPEVQDDDLPILVLVHGGAYQTGSKEMYRDWGPVLASQGYFVMAINYRLAAYGFPTYPGVLDDVSASVQWLVAQAHERGLDVNRIGLIGDSAGAHLVALFALMQPAFSFKICGVVGVYGLYDLAWEWNHPVSGRAQGMLEQLLGYSLAGHENLYRDASPMTYVQSAAQRGTFDTMFFLISGAVDKVVNPEQSRRFEHALEAAQIPVRTREIEDAGHFWFNLLPLIEGGGVRDYPNRVIKAEMMEFLDSTVKSSNVMNFARQRLRVLAASEGLSIKL